MPPLYFAKVPVHNKNKDGALKETLLPFLLPHELLYHMLKKNPGLLKDLCSLEQDSLKRLHTEWANKFEIDEASCVPIGTFGDGVPHQKRKGIEVFTWNTLKDGERFLFTAIGKDHTCQCGCHGTHTTHKIFEVFRWSMICLLNGEFPEARHDGEPWGEGDSERAKFKGKLGFWGCLIQARGDWSWFKQVFHFPGWANKQICWRCQADTEGHPWTDFSLKANWR
eukprot:11855465-Alexandrium_andersonii.AAC.1